MRADEDSTLDLIYGATADPTLWPDVIAKLRDLTGATDSVLFTPFLVPAHGGIHNSSWPDEVLDVYGSYYRDHDPWIRKGIARGLFTVRNVVVGEDLTNDAEWSGSEWYGDVLHRFGVGRLLSTLLTDPGPAGSGATTLCMSRPLKAAPLSAEEHAHIRKLVPDLQRALRIDRQLRSGGHAAGWSLSLVDQLQWAVFLLDRTSRVVHANSVAADLVRRADGLTVRAGFLQATRAQETNSLRLATASATMKGVGADLVVSRPSGLRPYMVTVVPLTPRTDEITGNTSIRGALHVMDIGAMRPSRERRFVTFFGFTPWGGSSCGCTGRRSDAFRHQRSAGGVDLDTAEPTARVVRKDRNIHSRYVDQPLDAEFGTGRRS